MTLNREQIQAGDQTNDAGADSDRSGSTTEGSPAAVGAGEGRASTSRQNTAVEHTTNSSLLLRLFTSQFFDSWLAVSYLFRYPQIVGVQHYLCNELRKFPLDELEFFLPQLVHLLITRPNESTAVESLLLDISLRSSHIAMLLYWYLQAYLSDLAPNPRTASFRHCQRIFNQMQELLFTDISPELIIDAPEPAQYAYLHAMENGASSIPRPGPFASLAARFKAMFRLTPQIRENSLAAMVGISTSLSSIGAPSLAPTMGWMAIAQGQRAKIPERLDDDEPDLPPQHNLLAGKTRSTPSSTISRSASMTRGRPSEKAAFKKNMSEDPEQLRKAYTASTTPSAGIAVNRSVRAIESETATRMSSSQPTRLSLGSHMGAKSGAEADANSTCGDADALLADVDPDNSCSASPSGGGVEEPGLGSNASSGPAQRKETGPAITAPTLRDMVGSRSPTPVGRDSTDSCHTVAVMETLERTRSVEARPGDSAANQDKKNVLPRKQYLDKATKQFQRNAKQLDRRMSRPWDSAKSATANGYLSAANAAQDFAGGRTKATCEEKAVAMHDTLADMAAYMEKERRKLERRTGYFSAEIRFMTALMDISQRVCAVPKAGRQQFLKAELTLLNHSLDKNTCIPLWCPDSDGSHHHRIVRIPTEDTVVLNSAERAPYLLTLEVLEPDMADHPESLKSASIVADGPGLIAADATSLSDAGSVLQQEPTAQLGEEPVEEKPAKAAANLSVEPSASKTNSAVDRRASAPSATAPAPTSAATPIQDVDEELMAEVFGDLDNVTDVPVSPLAPISNRRRTGGYSVNEKGKGKSKGKGKGKATQGGNHSGRPNNAPQSPHKHIHGHRQISDPHPGVPVRGSKHDGTSDAPLQGRPPAQDKHRPLPISVPPGGSSVARAPVSQEEIRARMRTASVLLAQLARQQKALGIKVANLVVPRAQSGASSDGTKAGGESTDTIKRRSKLGNATSQALAMEEIREKLIHEMMQLEELRLKQPGISSVPNSATTQDTGADGAVDSDIDLHAVEYKDDPSAKVLKEDWESKKARIRRASPYGRHKNWNLLSVIVKEGADLRQEQLALQLIREMQRIWQREQINVFVQYYRIMVTGEGCGLMETITNTVSVHSIKKEFYSRNPDYVGPPYTLYNYFVTSYGTPDTDRFREAQDNFMRSLVSYSLITYILQIRDRHNGNILLDTAGHIIHIDFGFMLSNSPGSVGFEQAPFKFPMEYVDILGGREGAKFAEFRDLLVKAFLGLRKYADNICLLVEMMIKDSPLPCLNGGASTVAALRDRFHLVLSEQQAEELVNGLLLSSCDNVTMRMYDAFQYYSNGIL